MISQHFDQGQPDLQEASKKYRKGLLRYLKNVLDMFRASTQFVPQRHEQQPTVTYRERPEDPNLEKNNRLRLKELAEKVRTLEERRARSERELQSKARTVVESTLVQESLKQLPSFRIQIPDGKTLDMSKTSQFCSVFLDRTKNEFEAQEQNLRIVEERYELNRAEMQSTMKLVADLEVLKQKGLFA